MIVVFECRGTIIQCTLSMHEKTLSKEMNGNELDAIMAVCVCALSENGSVQWSFVDAANRKFDTNFIRIYFCRIWKVIQCAIAHKNSLKFKSSLINWLSKRTIAPNKCNYIAENAKNNGDKEQQMHSKPSIEIRNTTIYQIH